MAVVAGAFLLVALVGFAALTFHWLFVREDANGPLFSWIGIAVAGFGSGRATSGGLGEQQ